MLMSAVTADAKKKQSVWPDGTAMDQWFGDTAKVDVAALGKQYVITDYGVKNDSALLQTEAIQRARFSPARCSSGPAPTCTWQMEAGSKAATQ